MSLDRPLTRRQARAAARAAAARPEPVVDAAKVAGYVTGSVGLVGGVTTALGYTTDGQVQAVTAAVGPLVLATGVLIGAVLPILRALRAREAVTPLASPRGADGVELVPARRT